MKIAIMQPYFMPYIGYFQLIKEVDKFVFFNDVNFIKKGWINRNQILNNKEPKYFTVPLIKASQNKLICDTYLHDFSNWRIHFLKKIKQCYKNSTYYNESFEVIERILYKKNFEKIDDLTSTSVCEISKYLGINTSFVFSKDLNYSKIGNGQHKIISISKLLGANTYVNLINGLNLYVKKDFDNEDLKLKFIKMNKIEYYQNSNNNFIPSLSIIDILMNNPKNDILSFMDSYSLQ